MVIEARALGVNVTEHAPPDSVQVPELRLPSPDGDALKVMVPLGVAVAPPVSLTVAVHVDG